MNKRKFFITMGAVLMVLGAMMAFFSAFYFFEVKPEIARRQDKTSPVKVSSKTEQGEGKAVQANQIVSGIGMEQLTGYAKNLYRPEELARESGSLWIDRQARRLVINLGSLNGVKTGDMLKVIDGDEDIASIKVREALDVVAYADVPENFEDAFPKDYYRVAKE